MSEEQQQLGEGDEMPNDDQLGGDDQINDDDQQADDQLENEINEQQSAVEEQAMNQGWVPKDQFKGHPDDHKTARHYVEWGEMQANNRSMKDQMNSLKKSHGDEIVGLNIINKANTDRQIKEVQSKINEAVENNDTAAVKGLIEEHSDLTTQKNNLENVSHGTSQADQSSVDLMRLEWEDKNPWFFDTSDPRVGVAHSAYNLAVARGANAEDAFKAVDAKVGVMQGKPRVNHNRNLPGNTTNSSGGGNKQTKNRKLTMAEVNPSEQGLRAAFPDGAAGDEIFLKAFENMRKGE